MVALVDQTFAPSRPATHPSRRRFTIVDEPIEPISIGRCDSCHGEELVLRVVIDVTDPGDIAAFDLCRGCAPVNA